MQDALKDITREETYTLKKGETCAYIGIHTQKAFNVKDR